MVWKAGNGTLEKCQFHLLVSSRARVIINAGEVRNGCGILFCPLVRRLGGCRSFTIDRLRKICLEISIAPWWLDRVSVVSWKPGLNRVGKDRVPKINWWFFGDVGFFIDEYKDVLHVCKTIESCLFLDCLFWAPFHHAMGQVFWGNQTLAANVW